MIASGCGVGSEKIEIMNTGASAVTVQSSDEDLGTIEANGGALVDTDDCYQGPIVVTYKGGPADEVSESLCPGQRLLIDDQDAKIVAEPAAEQ